VAIPFESSFFVVGIIGETRRSFEEKRSYKFIRTPHLIWPEALTTIDLAPDYGDLSLLSWDLSEEAAGPYPYPLFDC
jgi:hypothetical protein